jgi:predicted Ser/Thr protein kinase
MVFFETVKIVENSKNSFSGRSLLQINAPYVYSSGRLNFTMEFLEGRNDQFGQNEISSSARAELQSLETKEVLATYKIKTVFIFDSKSQLKILLTM